MIDTQTQSKRGGRRQGAGRKKDPESIRSQFAHAKDIGAHHSYSKYEIWRDEFILKHAHEFIIWLINVSDKSQRDAGKRNKTLMSRFAASRLMRLEKDLQLAFLPEALLLKAVAQYGEDEGPYVKPYVTIAKRLLQEKNGSPMI